MSAVAKYGSFYNIYINYDVAATSVKENGMK